MDCLQLFQVDAILRSSRETLETDGLAPVSEIRAADIHPTLVWSKSDARRGAAYSCSKKCW